MHAGDHAKFSQTSVRHFTRLEATRQNADHATASLHHDIRHDGHQPDIPAAVNEFKAPSQQLFAHAPGRLGILRPNTPT